MVERWSDEHRDAVVTQLLNDGWTCDFHEPDGECAECRCVHQLTAGHILTTLADADLLVVLEDDTVVLIDEHHFKVVDTDFRDDKTPIPAVILTLYPADLAAHKWLIETIAHIQQPISRQDDT
jgi:hypothetical protein